ncbi:hypothetical protein SAMN04488005_0805 [Yoonia tamlensis]|uniref:Uncharacterized protein n=1 Tax=Yoonia tamlensis TaxID=390270 RepID=A0A1I6FZK8_9RHOB|nr:hypothetical protein [Yoonia tamlensis]SFR35378.1 hypothetical protein SAMN04488005_0805 [Yoonia tamlensis]
MKSTNFLLALFLALLASTAMAETRNYYCDSGKLAFKSSTAVTLDEWTVIVGLEPRPDFGRQIFERPDGTYAWARTSEMMRVCRDWQACIPGPAAVTGLAVGPLIRRNDDGSVSLCDAPPTEVALYSCLPDGELSHAMIPNTPEHLRSYFGLDEPPSPDAVVFRPGDGSSVWHLPDTAAMRGACIVAPPENTPEDGIWSATLRQTQNNGCPPQSVAQAEAVAAAFAQEHRVVWPTPFTPAEIIPDTEFPRGWRANNGRWSALVVNQDHGVVRLSILFNLAVQSGQHIVIDSFLEMDMDATAAAAAGMAANCSLLSTFDLRKTGE